MSHHHEPVQDTKPNMPSNAAMYAFFIFAGLIIATLSFTQSMGHSESRHGSHAEATHTEHSTSTEAGASHNEHSSATEDHAAPAHNTPASNGAEQDTAHETHH